MNLKSIQITFNTHNDGKSASTVLHVFVKNRRPDTSTPMGPADYITNHLAYQFNQRPNFAGINEFLGCLENIAPRHCTMLQSRGCDGSNVGLAGRSRLS